MTMLGDLREYFRWISRLDGTGGDTITSRLGELNEDYPEAEIFWVDPSGRTNAVRDLSEDIPEQWTYEDILSIRAQDRNQEMLVLTSLIGNDPKQGFMVMRLPNSHILDAEMSLSGNLPLISIGLDFVGHAVRL
ncbi:hypothetical protein [Paenibacillus sp. MDMC362]|uniref:hypothetical protein n=1 Tax=Paenibacillus sp. MDMC362 TaxID=2977365 RepID=UPI0011BF0436|nr:hypothetical protein [Paenibacillus sp. MDMC362]